MTRGMFPAASYGMGRFGFLLFLAAFVGVALVARGLLRVHVHVPSGADARPFWRDKPADGPLPDPLRIWVEISREVRPAVVNISTTEKVKSPLGDDLFSRLFEGGAARRPRT